MPDLLKLLSQSEENTAEQAQPQSSSDEIPNQNYGLDQQAEQQSEEDQGYDVSGSATGDREQDMRSVNEQYSNKSLGEISTQNTRERYDDPTTWSPEYSDRGFFSEAGNSIMRGVGNSLIKGTGDMMQVIGGYMNEDIVKGTWFTKALQESGTEFADKFQSYMPEELKHENLTWASAMNPKFWSTHVAELIPNMLEFVLLSKGGSALARGAASKALKGSSSILGTAGKTALGEIVPGSAKGLVGKLATETGLTALGKGAFGAVGGGVTGNIFSGLQNAAELVNTWKDKEDDNGNLIFSNKELQEMAAGTVKNNAKWMMLDMASWGMTFGGGWKAARSINPLTKGSKLFTAAEQSTIAGKMFAYDVAPIFKGLSRVAGKAAFEGFEEMYQESFEEWAKKKAYAKATGKSITADGKEIGDDVEDFFTFFNSKENQATKVISAAMGALSGGAFNIKSLINSKADDNLRLYDRATNFAEIVNKQGTDKELEWQQYYTRDTIAKIVVDDDKRANDKEAVYTDFINHIVEKGNITEDEKKVFDKMFENFKEVKAKASNLNVKGLSALLHNNAIESHVTDKIAEFQAIAQENIKNLEEDSFIKETDKAKAIADIETSFYTRLKALSLMQAKAKQNQANLFIGKRADPLTMDIVTDEYGNDMYIGGLSDLDYYTQTKEGEKSNPGMAKLKLNDLTEAGKDFYNKNLEAGSSMFSGLKKKGEELIKKFKNGKADENADLDENGEAKTKPVVETIKEDEYQEFIKDGTVSKETLNSIAQKVKNQVELSENENAIFTDKTKEINDLLALEKKEEDKRSLKNLEVITDEEFALFEETNQVSEETLDSITDQVMSKSGLSIREQAIKDSFNQEILDRIVKKTLNTASRKKRQPSVIDNLSQNDVSSIEKELDVTIKRTDEGYDVLTDLEGDLAKEIIDKANEMIESQAEENLSVKEDGELSEEENAFVKEEATGIEEKGESIEDTEKAKNEEAKSSFKIDPKNITSDATSAIGLDARKKSVGDIFKSNVDLLRFKQSLTSLIRKNKYSVNADYVSKNQLDNYLNSQTAYNLKGPSNIDKMSSVNHQLKRMFSNTNDPAQVILVENLFESVGSQGLGMTLLGTVYIDEKAWEQDWVYMHEMSHIYFGLSKNEPETKALIKSALLNKELVERVKSKYDDQTLYYFNQPGSQIRVTKGQLFNFWVRRAADKNMLEEFLKGAIESGDVETIPLSQQDFLIEEMVVEQLEKKLTPRFDKVFNNISEVKRQKDTKLWWGMLRKKGAILQEEDGVDKMLRKLNDDKEIPQGDLKDFIFDTFKAVTKGVQLNGFAMDARAKNHSQEYLDEISSIQQRMAAEGEVENLLSEEHQSIMDEIDNNIEAMEDNGQMFYDKSFDNKLKGTTRILKRFGVVYNKSVRAKFAIDNKTKVVNRKDVQLFKRDLFESAFFNLATENKNSPDFIYNIENSNIKEIKAFNRYLNKVNPSDKLSLLRAMHYVLSNSTNVVGFRNTVSVDGKDNKQINHKFINSLANKEITNANNVLGKMHAARKEKGTLWQTFEQSARNIFNRKFDEKDIINVIDMMAPNNFQFAKIKEEGVIVYKGNRIPIETLIAGFIQKGMLFNPNTQNVYVFNARPIVEALVNTNRKFTPLSSVKNAEGNMEPVRITNNHLTKEIGNIIEYLSPDENGKVKTKEAFMNRFSHLNHLSQKERKSNYKHNQFLENIYDQFQNGVQPMISQYHGVEDTSNGKGSLYKNSNALEQSLEDFMTFVQTAVKPDLKGMNSNYLGNMGAFADSPRKFFMSMKRIAYDEVFDSKGNLKTNGSILNSVFRIHEKSFGDLTRPQFAKEFKRAVNETVDFINSNSEVLSNKNVIFQNNKSLSFKQIFNKEGKLNANGVRLVKEFALNSIVNGYNVTDVFAPGVKGKDIAKRFKLNSSPVMSVKNENFHMEPIFFADEILNNSISGTDGAMYILEEDALKYQKLGYKVFEMNGGFKFLNGSIEKDNPNFKGKTAYLKGYTTIINETHPLYKIMKARKDKWVQKFKDENDGASPSDDLSDGTPNHIVIAVPQSSDKSNFSPDKFIQEDADGNMSYTEKGQMFTEAALSENIEEAMKYYDNLYYDKKGRFLGINTYNFGPQQIMDKTTKQSNTPVQMVNSIIVNATLNGKLKEAFEIQGLISNQKRINLQQILDEIKSASVDDYKKLIMKGLNREDMNQAQRILLEDNGSLAHPYVNEIVVNQLAKTIRRMGNKLSTPGTYAHQKPDSGWRTVAKENKALKGYVTNGDGSLSPAEIVLPKHMENEINARTVLTVETDFGKQAIRQGKSNWSKKELAEDSYIQNMNLLQFAALALAEKRHGLEILSIVKKENISKRKAAERFIAVENNNQGVQIGYHVKGEKVIASRVPGHGPSSTGVFEAIGFDKGEGNQVMVSSEFNDITGSDNDGDALFIQRKAKFADKNFKNYKNWNEAFDKMSEYWLSKEMAEQITSKMDFKKETEEIVKNINVDFPSNNRYVMPHSPEAKRIDYENTMVSKRNVGPVFNIHKIANMLASSEVQLERSITIGGILYKGFADNSKGNSSRNQQSAILANIILDNAKYGFADQIGLDEHNIAQAVLLVNMGVPLEHVGKILNSPAAKLWSEFNRNNSSLYHESLKKNTIIKKIQDKLNIDSKIKASLKINLSTLNQEGQDQASVIELFSYMADMNSEIQKISTMMGGHNKIHVNPLVLENQIREFKNVLAGKSQVKTLVLNDSFKQSPDMQNYLDVAEATLEHTKRLNPVYGTSTNKVLQSITDKIGNDLSNNEIEAISEDILKFTTSRLLGLNNKPKDYVSNLMSQDINNVESIYYKVNKYLESLKDKVIRNNKDIKKSWNLADNSILFGQALNISIKTVNDKDQKSYISANSSFVNDSFNEVERLAAQEEFEELSPELRNDLIMYDMIQHGFKSDMSMAPFFGKITNSEINRASDRFVKDKDDLSKAISPKILEQLEKIIVLRSAKNKTNPFDKVYVKGTEKTKNEVVNQIFKDERIFNKIMDGQPLYVNVIASKKNISVLYEMEAFSDEEVKLINAERTKSGKRQRTDSIARSKMKRIKNTLTGNGDLDLALIEDLNIREPYNVTPTGQKDAHLDYLVEASITYEELMAKTREGLTEKTEGLDAREDFYIDEFTNKTPLSYAAYQMAMDFKDYVSQPIRKGMHDTYVSEKAKANLLIEQGVLNNLESKSTEQLNEMYKTFGERDVYAFSGIITPIVKQLAKNLMHEQMALNNKIKQDGKDISSIQAHMLTGSTIPSNHPASQGLARMIEKEYKNFINEKKKYMQEMNSITDALYKEKLGYGGESGLSLQGLKNFGMRIKDALFSNRQNIYERLYGNLIIREEFLNDQGTLVMNYKLKPKEVIEEAFANNQITKAEKDFYDHFRKTTEELKPNNLNEEKTDYIPHTSMSRLEMFSSRGLLGLMANSRKDDYAIYDVKLTHEGELKNFKTIEDSYKLASARGQKNDINKIKEYRAMKNKALALLKKGINEDGSKILLSAPFIETALGFGAINRFSNNRSVKATELPSMDLNKALGDYIHSTLFVNGNENFKGMLNLQGAIDGVLSWNEEHNLPNMNKHVQKVWKDYFLRGKRQKSFLGEKADKVVYGLTRLNLFYALGYSANANTGGLYAIGNVLAGKYHNIKDLGGKAWIKGEARFWGLDKGFDGGLSAINQRRKRSANIMKNLNFMEINVYDEVSMENKGGLDKIFTDIALSPMIYSEKWIQQTHMLGLLTDEQLDKFDENGNYKPGEIAVSNDDLIRLEDQVKSSHGRGYQPTDQRAVQMYSWGNMMLQFSRFIPTMVHDRFAKEDVNIYGRETIGTLRAVSKMVKYVVNNPSDFVRYRNTLSEEQRNKLDSGLKGLAMSTILSLASSTSDTANDLFWDANYYWNHPKLAGKITPSAIDSTRSLISSVF